MLLRDLLAPWFHYAGDEQFRNITLDSRAIVPGDVFVAVPGHAVDGRQYLANARAAGALACLVHTDEPAHHGRVSHDQGLTIEFFQLRQQLSALAAQAWPLAAGALQIIGITGTNGKTSVSQIIAQLQVLAGRRCAVMGTIGNGEWQPGTQGDRQLVDAGNTTADPLTVMHQLQQFANCGIDTCAMEVSSHALVQGRVEAVPFTVALFTNLTRDHLDYHGDMASYGAAKKRLLDFNAVQCALVNLDDATGAAWFADADGRYQGFSVAGNHQAAYRVLSAEYHPHGVRAHIAWPGGEGELDSPLLGQFNLSNLLAALAALHALGMDMPHLCTCVSHIRPVAGRMECFPAPGRATLVVDYAHTPDGLEQALKAARSHSQGKLWCLFGCGGDRDKGKRPMMAAVAEANADHIMLTSDNARSEDPLAIIADMQAGLSQPSQALVNPDRQAAIQQVFALAAPGDIVLLAGKGHETYQEIAGIKHHYSERAFAAELARAGQ